jgi:uncharacterized protein
VLWGKPFILQKFKHVNKLILLLGLATLVIFGAIGIWLVEQIQQENFIDMLLRGLPLWQQLIIGTLYGFISALIAWKIICSRFFTKEKLKYAEIIGSLNLNAIGIIFISLCAGIGEEIAFRAGIQPLLGIWLTSIIFVALHGYLNPLNWRISIYGFSMIFVIAGMGYLFEETGLISAMTAHAVFDMVLIKKLIGSNNKY